MIEPRAPTVPTEVEFSDADLVQPEARRRGASAAAALPLVVARSQPIVRRSPRRGRTLTMVALDALPFLLAWAVSGLPGGSESVVLVQDAVMAAVAVSALALYGAYTEARRPNFATSMDHRPLTQLIRFILIASLAAWAGVLVQLDLGRAVIPHGLLLVWTVAPAWWLLVRALSRRFHAQRQTNARALIIGSGEVAEQLAAHLARNAPGLEVVGRADDGDDPRFGGPPLLGELADLAAVVSRYQIDHVFVAFSHRGDAATARALRTCDAIGVHTLIVPRLFDILGDRPRPLAVGSLPLQEVRPLDRRAAWEPVRRLIDLVIAGAALVVLSPLIAAVAVAVALFDGRPIFYRQERTGRYGRPFHMIKFRTMRNAPDHGLSAHAMEAVAQEDMPDLVRTVKEASMTHVTRLGRALRAASLDELPQLWNVLRGDMSIVGPRPLRVFEVRSLESWQLTRLRVRPGMTGLWQVRGRSDLDWSERMRLDYLYVRHRSVAGDLAILTDTIPAVFGRRGAH